LQILRLLRLTAAVSRHDGPEQILDEVARNLTVDDRATEA